MDNLTNALNICVRLVYAYNETHEEKINIWFDKSKLAYETLRKSTDKVLNEIKFQNLPPEVRAEWMNDKFAYVSWARDTLILNENLHNNSE
jgi:hypothetical protein